MATRSLNKVLLIGNLTRDPELRYTPQGTAVVTFGLATNRSWVTESGERREDTEFHRIVAWNKLAELCAQLLFKGRRVFVEGRLSTRRFVGADNQERQITEIVIDDMLILDSRRMETEGGGETYPTTEATQGVASAETPNESSATVEPETEPASEPTAPSAPPVDDTQTPKTTKSSSKKSTSKKESEKESEKEPDDSNINPEDIPF